MNISRFSRRSIVCAVVAAFLLLTAQAGPASAQWDGPPADLAEVYWRQGYVLHVLGAYVQATERFRRSIAVRPTAEGHTYLGWSLSHMGHLDEAIAECKRAIKVDPNFGNPYNDIGVYLVELGREDEAIPWLRQAIRAKRYCCYHFANLNLGQILLKKGRVVEATRMFERALKFDPDYGPAKKALEKIRRDWL